MTVKKLIEKLEKIENKDLPVSVGVEYGHGCFAVSTDVGPDSSVSVWAAWGI